MKTFLWYEVHRSESGEQDVWHRGILKLKKRSANEKTCENPNYCLWYTINIGNF